MILNSSYVGSAVLIFTRQPVTGRLYQKTVFLAHEIIGIFVKVDQLTLNV